MGIHALNVCQLLVDLRGHALRNQRAPISMTFDAHKSRTRRMIRLQ